MVQNLSSQSRQSLTEVNSLPKREISVRESGIIYVILQKDLSAPGCQTDCNLTFCCFYANVKHLDLLSRPEERSRSGSLSSFHVDLLMMF